MAEYDTEWLLEHAADVAAPSSLFGMLRTLGAREQRASLIEAMGWTREAAAEVLDKPWHELRLESDEVQHLRDAMRAAVYSGQCPRAPVARSSKCVG